LSLQPWLGPTHAYGAFYPAIFLVAYVLGRPPAYVAAALAAVAGLWAFVDPAFGWKFQPESLAPLVFFAVTAWAGIWLITALTAGLETLGREQGRSQAVADAHAELFKELQARIGYQMQLISGVLLLQARSETTGPALELLRAAGERSQLIARAHREFTGEAEADVDFLLFAQALGRSVCAEVDLPESSVEISGDGILLPSGDATSLGVALVECLLLILKRRPSGRLRVGLARSETVASVTVSHSGSAGSDVVTMAPAAQIFRAMIEQIGADVRLVTTAEGAAAIEVRLPLRTDPVPRSSEGAGATLH
jgi:two-component sensor histidine kinase